MIPCITELEENRYVLPDVAKTVEVFRGERFNEKELERQLTHSGSFTRLLHAKARWTARKSIRFCPFPLDRLVSSAAPG